jgi:dihydrofolate reductase
MFWIIVALDLKNGIGKNNKLPWNLPPDLKKFKEYTTDGTIIMGKNTWDSLPVKPLPKRKNIIISSTMKSDNQIIVFNNLNTVLNSCEEKTFVIGGSLIYNQSMNHPVCEKIIVTRILDDFNCDVKIDNFPSNFILEEKSEIKTYKDINYVDEIWIKI